MNLQIDYHTLERPEERGVTEAEIKDVIRTGYLVPARYGRLRMGKVYEFNQTRHGRHFQHKRVEVVFIIEDDKIITVTVYPFYGYWAQQDADSI